MFNFLDSEGSGSTPQQIARSFRWLGWMGLALQSLLGFIPILVVTTNIMSRPGQQPGRFSGGLWLSIACLIILFFSIYWCFRYTQLASRLEDRDRRPAKAQVIRDVKWGLVANIGIMAIAVFVALLRVGELTFTMLRVPQGATVITANPVGSTVAQGAVISPSNMIAIQAMVNAIAAGLVGAIVALLLLYQIGSHRNAE